MDIFGKKKIAELELKCQRYKDERDQLGRVCLNLIKKAVQVYPVKSWAVPSDWLRTIQ